MNYGQIIQQAWHATWRNRSLWWLGMAVLGAANAGQLLSLSRQDWHTLRNLGTSTNYDLQTIYDAIWDLLVEYQVLLLLVVISVGLLIVVMYVCHFIAIGGIYQGASWIRTAQPISFKLMCRAGTKTVWRVAGISIVLSLVVGLPVAGMTALLILIGSLPNGYLFSFILSYVIAILLLPVGWIVISIRSLAIQSCVFQASNVTASIKRGWQLWRLHLKDTALMYALNWMVRIVTAMAGLLVAGIIAVPLVIFSYFAYSSQAWLALGLIFVVGVSIILTFGLILKGISQSFLANLWHGLYAGIAQR